MGRTCWPIWPTDPQNTESGCDPHMTHLWPICWSFLFKSNVTWHEKIWYGTTLFSKEHVIISRLHPDNLACRWDPLNPPKKWPKWPRLFRSSNPLSVLALTSYVYGLHKCHILSLSHKNNKSFVMQLVYLYLLIRNYTTLQNLDVWVWRKGQGQLLHEQARKNPEGLGFDPGATCNLSKWHRIPGCTSSSYFPQLVPAYSIHTVTTQCGSGNYLVEALNVLILCAHLCCKWNSQWLANIIFVLRSASDLYNNYNIALILCHVAIAYSCIC